MPEKTSWLDNLNKSSERLHKLSFYMEELAMSFFEVGNPVMYRKLLDVSKSLSDISENVNESSGKVVNEMFNTAQKNSTAVLNAALAGIKVATDENKNKKNK